MTVKRRRGERERERGEEDDGPLELKLYKDPWAIKKKLTESDLNHLSRLILPRDQVEKHVLPHLKPNEVHDVKLRDGGIKVWVWDMDTDTYYSLSFKMWKSNGSYKLGQSWIPDFVRRRNLGEGDMIGMFWDDSTSCFCFSVLERVPPVDAVAETPVDAVAETVPPLDHFLREFARKHLHLSQPTSDDPCSIHHM